MSQKQVERLLQELTYLIGPLVEAVRGEVQLRDFFRGFGYELPTDPKKVLEAINEQQPTISDTTDDLLSAVKQGGGTITVARNMFSAVRAFSENSTIQEELNNAIGLGPEIIDGLIRSYLGLRAPWAVAILQALGVLEEREIDPDDPDGRDVLYLAVSFKWSQLGLFIQDNAQWALDNYGWGGHDFDHQLALRRFAVLIEATQLASTKSRPLSDEEKRRYFLHAESTDQKVELPFGQEGFEDVDDDGCPIFEQEIGFKVLPYDATDAPFGLALAPYTHGFTGIDTSLNDSIHLNMRVDAEATGGAVLTLQPNKIGVAAEGSVDASFETTLQISKPDDNPMILVGDEDGSHISAGAALVTLGGNLNGDFYIAGGVAGLGAEIDVGDDGFLGSLIPRPIEVEAGDILMGWRIGRGVYFEGGTSISVAVPMNLDVGPVNIQELGLSLDWESETKLSLTLTGDARLGPLYAYLEKAGVDVKVVPALNGDGLFGRYDAQFSFRTPSGYAISLEAEAIKGGGLLSINGSEYRGALALQFQNIGFSAFAILNTELPNGRSGFSFAASIFASLNLPLGYGFFLTGLGGIIGINRTIDTDAMRKVLFEGRLDNLLFPADPISSASQILNDMAAILPAQQDQHIFGPVAKISWGVPSLVDVKLGVVIEVGKQVRVLILGGLSSVLPTREAALVSLKLSFFGEIDFAAATIGFDGSVQNSRILNWPVSGDVAIRSGWAARINHIASFGGLHPQFPRPENLPSLRRMSIEFGSKNPRITLSAYQAITLNSLQFGARVDLYARGPKVTFIGRTAADGEAYFDALIYFNPFAFDVRLGGSLSLLVGGDRVCSLGFRLQLTGPNTFTIKGKVWVTVYGIDISFSIKHTWGEPQSLPEATVNGVNELRRALQETQGFEATTPRQRSSSVGFRDGDDIRAAVDPLGGLRFVQRALPLGVHIDKIGNAQLSGARSFDLRVFKEGQALEVSPTRQDFVRGHFFSMSDDEKLRTPAFESYRAGFDFSPDELAVDDNEAVIEGYDYEVIRIPVDRDIQSIGEWVSHGLLKAEFAKRFMAADHELRLRPQESFQEIIPVSNPILVEDYRYIHEQKFQKLREQVTSLSAAGRTDYSSLFNITEANVTQVRSRPAELASNSAVAAYVALAQMGVR